MNLARWIVSRLGVESGDHIVEIGPGLGALTELLVREDALLTLIEKDEHMVNGCAAIRFRSRGTVPRRRARF